MKLNVHLRWIPLCAALLALAACGNPEGPAPVYPGGPGGPGAFGGAPGEDGGVGRSRLAELQHQLAVVAGDRVFFDYDQSGITDAGQQVLQRQAEWLRQHPHLTVTIEGHTDERGTREYNLSLGERRAQAVKNVLIAAGISASRIATVSYGKERPEVPHSDEKSYAENRRAVTVIN